MNGNNVLLFNTMINTSNNKNIPAVSKNPIAVLLKISASHHASAKPANIKTNKPNRQIANVTIAVEMMLDAFLVRLTTVNW